MLDGPDTTLEFKILILSIIIDMICIYKLLKWNPPPEIKIKNILITIISGIILYITIGFKWYNTISITTTDPWGITGSTQIGMIAVSICPALIIMTIWTYIKYKRKL